MSNTFYALQDSVFRRDRTVSKNIDYGFVADLYDAYVNTELDIPFYRRLCANYSGNVLELMCGTGRVSIPLIEAGVPLTCVDYSQEMLDVLKAKLENRSTPVLCQDVCNLSIDRKFDLIFIPFHSIAEITNKDLRKKALKRIYEHLSDVGEFFCTLYNPSYRIKSVDGHIRCLGRFDINDEKTLIVTYYNSYNQPSNLVYGTQFYEIYDRQNKLVDKRFLSIEFSLITQDEFLDLCKETGFQVKHIYGDYEFGAFESDSMFMNFLLTK